jgi:hypothetical protein
VPLPSSGEKKSSRPTLHTRVYSGTLGLASFKCAVLLRAGSMYKNAQSSSSPTQEITRRRSRFRSGTLSQVPKRCSRPCISTSTPLLRGHQTKLDSYRPLLTGTMEKKPTDSPRWLPKSNPGQQFTQDPKNVTAGSTPPLLPRIVTLAAFPPSWGNTTGSLVYADTLNDSPTNTGRVLCSYRHLRRIFLHQVWSKDSKPRKVGKRLS